MIDQEVSTTTEVWGIDVPILSGGSRRWPDAIRVKAVDRIRAGENIKDIAHEIGANESLVAKWATATAVEKSVPAFVELARPKVTNGGRNAFASPVSPPVCKIQIGDTGITIPPDYPSAHLAEVLRAVQESQ